MLLLSMVAVSDCLELKNGSFLSLRSKTRRNVSNFLKEIFLWSIGMDSREQEDHSTMRPATRLASSRQRACDRTQPAARAQHLVGASLRIAGIAGNASQRQALRVGIVDTHQAELRREDWVVRERDTFVRPE